MKILWLTETPSKYKTGASYNGRGWIESLQTLVEEHKDIVTLGVAFPHSTDTHKLQDNKVIYYPIKRVKSSNFVAWIISNWARKIEHKAELSALKSVIEDFKPDVIHIFGTESWLCHAVKMTNTPCVVHLQGLLQPYLNAYLPIGISNIDLIRVQWTTFIKGISLWHSKRIFEQKAKREYQFFKDISFFMGRTNWDESVSKLLSPKSTYFHVDEILRNPFYNANPWDNYKQKKLLITSTLSDTIYKGLDLVIKTASILNKEGIEFEWQIIGVTENSITAKLFRNVFRNNYKAQHIRLLGVKTAEEIVNLMTDTSIYVHTSYIDNSPNSVCEAQLIGVPVIATNVGGVSSLIENGKNGFLVPANDSYSLAARIVQLAKNEDMLKSISRKGRETAQKRHSKEDILAQLITTYNILKRKEQSISVELAIKPTYELSSDSFTMKSKI